MGFSTNVKISPSFLDFDKYLEEVFIIFPLIYIALRRILRLPTRWFRKNNRFSGAASTFSDKYGAWKQRTKELNGFFENRKK